MTLNAQVTHIYQNPPEHVFDAWLSTDMIGQWMFGPKVREEEIINLEIDPIVGGNFSFLVSRGNTVIDHIGTYLIIDRPKHLEFNWGVKGMSDNSRVIVDILPQDNGCKLTLVHELHPDWKDYFERTKEGWAMMLNLLDQALIEKFK